MNFTRSYREFILLILFALPLNLFAQNVERVYMPNILTPQLFRVGIQQGIPIISLNSADRLELEFDDLSANVKSYYYTLVLCDYNWKPVDLNQFDYIKGFTQNRITTYRYSSIALTRYTHYQAFLPDQSSKPTRSGNYLLKVFLDADTSKLAFTKQMMIVDPVASISASVVQPFSPDKAYTYQKVRFTANLGKLNSFSAAHQVKVVILQNNRWDIAQRDIIPTFVRGNILDFSAEPVANFPAGKEWRWLDLRSFRLQSDRVDHADYGKTFTEMYLKTDMDRRGLKYIYYPDYNGSFNIVTYESINPFWQADYATVHFYLAKPDGTEYPNKDIYLAGAFTSYQLEDRWKMIYNPESMKYECNAFLKQGYYDYTYIMVDRNDPAQRVEMEGDYWETENSYTILVYYKSFTDRNDQLIGASIVNSRSDKPGFSF